MKAEASRQCAAILQYPINKERHIQLSGERGRERERGERERVREREGGERECEEVGLTLQ